MTQPDSFSHPDDVATRNTFSARDALLGWMQEIAPYGIFTTDVDLRIRSWNQWLVSHSGLTAERVIGRPLLELFPDIQARRLDEPFRRALAGEISVLSTALHKYLLPLPTTVPDASVPHMLQTVRIAPLPTGDLILGTITIIEDVTQRELQAVLLQRQQEQDRLLSAILASLLKSSNPMQDMAALFPNLALPLGLSSYFSYLFDEASETLQLHTAAGVLPKHREALAVLRRGESLCGQCAAERRPIARSNLQTATDDSAALLRRIGFRAFCCFPLIVDERLFGVLAFASTTRDVLSADELSCFSTAAQYLTVALDRAAREQALRNAQARLRESAEILEAKVVERTAELNETVSQLESFTYAIAHDLRAPMRSLRGYCEILKEDYVLPRDAGHIVDRLQRSVQHLDALTRDLLRFSTVSQEQIQLGAVQTRGVIDELRAINPALRDGVLVVENPLEDVWAHRHLLYQCLSSLFDNAMKFARPGVPPRIVIRSELRAAAVEEPRLRRGTPFNPAVRAAPVRKENIAPRQEESRRVRIWVEDNGIGIPPDMLTKIFGIFERLDISDLNRGTGIGLAIVARAVQRMGGTCGVESTLDVGSRFWLEFHPAA